jgi:hypothetical protein
MSLSCIPYVSPIRLPPMVGLTREKALKENLVDKAYEKWTELEE